MDKDTRFGEFRVVTRRRRGHASQPSDVARFSRMSRNATVLFVVHETDAEYATLAWNGNGVVRLQFGGEAGKDAAYKVVRIADRATVRVYASSLERMVGASLLGDWPIIERDGDTLYIDISEAVQR